MSELSGRVCAILAAGASRRFRGIKALARLPDDRSLVEHVLHEAQSSLAESVLLVLGAHREAISREISTNSAKIAINMNWENGLSSSIHCALDHASNASALMLVPMDLPGIQRQDFNQLWRAWMDTPNHRIASEHNSGPGAPAIFPAQDFHLLRTLSGDRGAGALLASSPTRLQVVSVPGAHEDIDTPDDLARWCGDL